MANIDIEKILKDASKELSEDVIKSLEDNREFLQEMGKDQLTLLFHYVTQGSTADLDSTVYQQLLSKATDEQFLELRKQTVEAAREWARISAQKTKIVDDLVSKVGKMAANIIVRQIILSSIS